MRQNRLSSRVIAILLASSCISYPTLLHAADVAGKAEVAVTAFNIPRQDASTALIMFANQAEVQVVMQAKSVRGLMSQPLAGHYGAHEALALLTSGLRLDARWVNAKMVTVQPDSQDIASTAPTARHDRQVTAPVDAAPTDATDIVVTARRTSENIQSVPITINAFNAENLRKASIHQTSDLMMKTPGVFLNGSNSRENPIYVIRGQSKALSGAGAPAVVSYFAEVPSPTFGSSAATYDMSSVQILKGPQGTLFGRNTTGGAILYYPTAPGYKLDGYVEGSYGRYDNRQLEAAVTLPIVADHISIRVAGQYHRQANYTKNLLDYGGLDGTNARAFRVSLRLDPVSGLSNTTIFDYYLNRYSSESVVLDSLYDSFGLLDILGVRPAAEQELAAQQARGRRTVESDVTPNSRALKIGVTNRSEWTVTDHVSLVNIFGYRHTNVAFTTNVDGVGPLVSSGADGIPAGTPFELVNADLHSDVDQYSDEVQIKGRALGGRLNWIVGGFYLDSKPVGPSGIVVPVATIPGVTEGSFGYNFNSEKSRALFGNGSYDLGTILHGLKLNAGFRYTWDTITACTGSGLGEVATVQPDECVASNPNILLASRNRAQSSAPTWSFGLDWQVAKDLFTYVTTRRGYRAGGINGPTLGEGLKSVQSYNPETITDVEIGARSSWHIGRARFRLNGSAYIGYYNGVQISVTGVQSAPGCKVGDSVYGKAPYTPDGDCDTNNDPTGGTVLVNAGKAQIAGADMDFLFAPTDRLSFTVAGSLVYPKTRSINPPAVVSQYLSLKKITFVEVAKQTISAGAEYKIPIDPGQDVVLNADYYWSSKRVVPGAAFKAYDLVNLRLAWNGIAGRPVDLSLYATNVFNKDYVAMDSLAGDAVGAVATVHGSPRQYGVSLRYRFGG